MKSTSFLSEKWLKYFFQNQWKNQWTICISFLSICPLNICFLLVHVCSRIIYFLGFLKPYTPRRKAILHSLEAPKPYCVHRYHYHIVSECSIIFKVRSDKLYNPGWVCFSSTFFSRIHIFYLFMAHK